MVHNIMPPCYCFDIIGSFLANDVAKVKKKLQRLYFVRDKTGLENPFLEQNM